MSIYRGGTIDHDSSPAIRKCVAFSESGARYAQNLAPHANLNLERTAWGRERSWDACVVVQGGACLARCGVSSSGGAPRDGISRGVATRRFINRGGQRRATRLIPSHKPASHTDVIAGIDSLDVGCVVVAKAQRQSKTRTDLHCAFTPDKGRRHQLRPSARMACY